MLLYDLWLCAHTPSLYLSQTHYFTFQIVANVDSQHTASISVIAHTAKVCTPRFVLLFIHWPCQRCSFSLRTAHFQVTISWRAKGSRYLLNKVGNPLLDQTGNIIPQQYFVATGILTTNDYYSYDVCPRLLVASCLLHRRLLIAHIHPLDFRVPLPIWETSLTRPPRNAAPGMARYRATTGTVAERMAFVEKGKSSVVWVARRRMAVAT